MNIINLVRPFYLKTIISLNNYIIVEDAQNLTKLNLKEIISKVKKNSKIILIGDFNNVNEHSIDNNALLSLINKMNKQSIFGHIEFKDINTDKIFQKLKIDIDFFKNKYENINFNYGEYRKFQVNKDFINELYNNKVIYYNNKEVSFLANEYVSFKAEGESEYIARFDKKDNLFYSIDYYRVSNIFGINPLNNKQKILIDVLLNSKVKLVFLDGNCSTGKTFISLACGLEICTNSNTYNSILITKATNRTSYHSHDPKRVTTSISGDLRNFFSILYLENEENIENTISFMLDNLIEIILLENLKESISLQYKYIIIDNAHYLTESDIINILSNIGKNSKVILISDLSEIYKNNLLHNPLFNTIQKTKDEEIIARVFLDEVIASELSKIIFDIL